MNAALQADFGRAALPCLDGAARDLLEREVVRPAAQVVAQLALRECAEAAGVAADVGVIDVAINHVMDDVAAYLRAQRVGGRADLLDFGTARREQAHDIVRSAPVARARPSEEFSE